MSAPEPIRWLDVGALLAAPPPPVPWVVEPLLARGTVTVLAGQPGVGKSLLAIKLAAAVARGEPSVGGMAVHGGPVVLLDAENGERTLHERAHLVALPTERVVVGITEGFDFREPDSLAQLESAIMSAGAVLVVLDSLSSLAPGLKENDAHDVTPALESVRRLARRTDAAVLLLHHTRKAGDAYRGGTGIPAAADIAAVYKRDGKRDPNQRVLDWSPECGGKMRLGPEPPARHLRVGGSQGRLVVDAVEVVESADASASSRQCSRRRAALSEQAIAVVSRQGPMHQGALLRAIGCDPTDRTARRALDDAVASGRLHRDDDGTFAVPEGGTSATPASVNCQSPQEQSWQAAPLKGAATCQPAVGDEERP